MAVKITSVTKQIPEFTRNTDQIIDYIKVWLEGKDERFQRKVIKIFENAEVDQRYSIMDADDMFTIPSFEKRNEIYVEKCIELGEACLVKALKKAQLKPTDVDYIITVSCTGFMIPSLDAYLINKLKMKKDIIRLPVTEMGCAAGISGMIYANNFLKANPNKRAAVIAVESPMATFQMHDFSMVNIVSSAIFGDGAACAILSSHKDDIGPKILDEAMYHFYDAETMMGFKMTDTGLQMILDQKVPEVIAEHFPEIIHPFLKETI